jgi:hypothetical protein
VKRTKLIVISLLCILILAGIIPGASALVAPSKVSPAIDQVLYHYPRTTTLAWKPVPGATGYEVEYAYSDGTWHSYPIKTVDGNVNTHYTFDFVGDQPGRWRVKALSPTGNSAWSLYRGFSYTTQKPRLPTPVKTSPLDGTIFYHYPRTTTLAWKPVPGAASYTVERQYCLGSQCWPYDDVTVTNPTLTFDFVGAQPGKWRVTANAPNDLTLNSAPALWRGFSYTR